MNGKSFTIVGIITAVLLTHFGSVKAGIVVGLILLLTLNGCMPPPTQTRLYSDNPETAEIFRRYNASNDAMFQRMEDDKYKSTMKFEAQRTSIYLRSIDDKLGN